MNKATTRPISSPQAALVVAHLGYHVVIDCNGALWLADWRKQLGSIAVNDRVMVTPTGEGQAVIESISPRRHTLYKWQGRHSKAVASNLDQILIVIAPEPAWQYSLIDRYLIAAKSSDIKVGILMNKMDLLDEAHKTRIQQQLSLYHSLECRLFLASTKDQASLTDLRQWLEDKETLICGQSGVGKSSLIHALLPEVDIWIQSLSHASGLGQHTTTNLRRYPFANGAIIDSPGVRGFSLNHLSCEAILDGFPDIYQHADGCRFKDCRHEEEPDCAVKSAVGTHISPERWKSYQQLLKEKREQR